MDILIGGLVVGALYAIVALGYTMVYGIIELINFAHGDVFTLGAFIAIPVMNRLYTPSATSLQVPVWTSIWIIAVCVIVSTVVCATLNVVIERVAYRPLRNAPRLAPLITAIGVSLILENAMYQWQGGLPISAPLVISQTTYSIFSGTRFSASVTNVEILVIVVALVMLVGLDLFVNRTNVGKAMRAVAQDREAAAMMGINVDRIISLTFLVGAALAGAGSVFYLLYIGSVVYSSGFTLGLFAFTAAVLGGIGNIRGAVLGGLFIGLVTIWIDSLGNGGGTQWYEVVVFTILILILVFRPAGLLGTNTAEKV
jgi:branched-chain amino acid transport system permease protein